MKFLKRKSQRDDQSAEAEHTRAGSSYTRDPSPNPVAKDLPPPPLYARYARITSTPSFDSLNTTLETASATPFSANNGSTASGFGNTPSALRAVSPDSANAGSQGRAAGSVLLRGGDAPSSSSAAPTTATPEPIKLKQRGRRVVADAPATRVVSMVENRSNENRPSLPSKPVRAWTNGSVDAPTADGANSVLKPSFEDRLVMKGNCICMSHSPRSPMSSYFRRHCSRKHEANTWHDSSASPSLYEIFEHLQEATY